MYDSLHQNLRRGQFISKQRTVNQGHASDTGPIYWAANLARLGNYYPFSQRLKCHADTFLTQCLCSNSIIHFIYRHFTTAMLIDIKAWILHIKFLAMRHLAKESFLKIIFQNLPVGTSQAPFCVEIQYPKLYKWKNFPRSFEMTVYRAFWISGLWHRPSLLLKDFFLEIKKMEYLTLKLSMFSFWILFRFYFCFFFFHQNTRLLLKRIANTSLPGTVSKNAP